MDYIFSLVILLSFSLSTVLICWLLPRLRRLAEQPIYEEGPHWHQTKQGTPTMGGIGFILGMFLTLLLVLPFLLRQKEEIFLSLLINFSFALLNALIGIFDDIKKIRHKQNEGLTPKEKLFYQTLVCVLYLFSRTYLLGMSTSLSLFGWQIDLGFFFYPLALFVMLGVINCANLTDGVDALASSVALSLGLALYLLSPALTSDAPLIGALMIGGALAFLLFNLHPAKIFMGDSGSLFFGAFALSACFSLENPFLILLLGGVYIIEGFSVVIQVIYYKLTHKRIFKMAPLHHHLELCGVGEVKIAFLGLLFTFLFSLIAFFF